MCDIHCGFSIKQPRTFTVPRVRLFSALPTILIAALVHTSCSGDGSCGVEGLTQVCLCGVEATGVQICQVDETWSPCVCPETVHPETDGAPDAETLDTPAPDTGAEDETPEEITEIGSVDASGAGDPVLDLVADDAVTDARVDERDTDLVEDGLSDSTLPRIISTTPRDGDFGVPTTIVVTATFSDDLEPVSVNAESFSLRDSENRPVASSLSVEGNLIVLEPTSPLLCTEEYSVRATTAIRDRSGDAMERDYEWRFGVFEGSWTEPILVFQAAGEDLVSRPAVGIDEHGNIQIVWARMNDGDVYKWWNLMSSEYAGEGEWRAAELISQPNLNGYATYSMSTAGYGHSAWKHWDSTREGWEIVANSFDPLVGWGDPVVLDNSDDQMLTPSLTVDRAGNAVAVWFQASRFVYGPNRLFVGRRTTSSSWYEAQPIATVDHRTDPASAWPTVATDTGGNAVVAWLGLHSVWSSYYSSGGAWSEPVRLDNRDDDFWVTSQGVPLAMDDLGNAIAVWRQFDAYGRYGVFVNRYSTAEGWGEPFQLDEVDLASSDPPTLAMTGEGETVVSWFQRSNPEAPSCEVWFAERENELGWRTPRGAPSDCLVTDAEFVLSESGLGAFSYLYLGAPGSEPLVRTRHYRFGMGFGDEHTFSARAVHISDYNCFPGPRAAINSAGTTVVAWRSPGEGIWASLFDACP